MRGILREMTSVTEADVKVDLPPRYSTRWREPFDENVFGRLTEGIMVLDVGSGRNPTVPPHRRPLGTTYVGLDVSADELRAAGPGAYDDTFVADVAERVPALVGNVDLAVSWQVFEHVKPLDVALDNVRDYLKPGGTLVSLFSGGWSAFGVVNRLLPNAIGNLLVERSMRRMNSNQPVFPAYYDRCSEHALRSMMNEWSEVVIYPLFHGATYFHFSRILTRFYLAYENAVRRARLGNLATHYLLVARR